MAAPSNSPITSHILNQVTGEPGAGIYANLSFFSMDTDGYIDENGLLCHLYGTSDHATGRITSWSWVEMGSPKGVLQSTQRVPCLKKDETLIAELKLMTREYWKARGMKSFYPEVLVRFEVETDSEGRIKGHYHVPVLLGPWGYTTYRGN